MPRDMKVKVFKGKNFDHVLSRSYDYVMQIAKHDKNFLVKRKSEKSETYALKAQ